MATFQDAQMPPLNGTATPNLAALAEIRNQGEQNATLMWQKHLLEKLWGLSGSASSTQEGSSSPYSRLSAELPNNRQGKKGSMNFLSEIQYVRRRRWQFSVVSSIIVRNADFSQKVEYPDLLFCYSRFSR